MVIQGVKVFIPSQLSSPVTEPNISYDNFKTLCGQLCSICMMGGKKKKETVSIKQNFFFKKRYALQPSVFLLCPLSNRGTLGFFCRYQLLMFLCSSELGQLRRVIQRTCQKLAVVCRTTHETIEIPTGVTLAMTSK